VVGVANTPTTSVVGQHWVVKYPDGQYLTTGAGLKARFMSQRDALLALQASGIAGEVATEWTE